MDSNVEIAKINATKEVVELLLNSIASESRTHRLDQLQKQLFNCIDYLTKANHD